MPKVTQWYPGTIKPAREGVYERDGKGKLHWRSYWDGQRWSIASYTTEGAFADKGHISCFQELRWRGLAKEPK